MICPTCKAETTEALTCEPSRLLREQQVATFRATAHEGPGPCSDCGCFVGGHHHAFCGLMIPHRLVCNGCDHHDASNEVLFGFDPFCGETPVDPGFTDEDWRGFISTEAK